MNYEATPFTTAFNPPENGPAFTINGKPIVGTFSGKLTVQDVRDAIADGVNLFFCYERGANADLLDPETEMGRLLYENKVMAMTAHVVRIGYTGLKEDISATDTEITVKAIWRKSDGPAVAWLEDEAIYFDACVKGVLKGCRRGWSGTKAVSHKKDVHLLFEREVREAFGPIRHSPNLWGVWMVDDRRGDEAAALRHAYRILREMDHSPEERAYHHVMMMGMSPLGGLEKGAIKNLRADNCDMAGIYTYPSRQEGYRNDYVIETLKEQVPVMKQINPNLPFMGIYQAFSFKHYIPVPTRYQVRKQINEFIHFGAAGTMAYSWRPQLDDAKGMFNMPEWREELRRLVGRLESGQTRYDQPMPIYEPRPDPQPDLSDLKPVLTFKPENKVLESTPILKVTLRPGADGLGEMLFDYAKYVKGAPQWPAYEITASKYGYNPDMSAGGFLVVRVRNFLDEPSEIGVGLSDSRKEKFRFDNYSKYYPLEASDVTDVVVPLDEAAQRIDTWDVSKIRLLMRRPPTDTRMAVLGIYLAKPLYVSPEQRAIIETPEVEKAPRIDGDDSDDCWKGAPEVALMDTEVRLEPARYSHARAVTRGDEIGFLLDNEVGSRGELFQVSDPSIPWQGKDDTVMAVIRNPETGARIVALANSTGRVDARLYKKWSLEYDRLKVPVGSRLHEDGRWIVEMKIDTTGLGPKPKDGWEAMLVRRDSQLGPAAWPRPAGLPIGAYAVGSLRP